MNSRKLFHHRYFQYFNSFRVGDFPSALRSIASFIDNKQINDCNESNDSEKRKNIRPGEESF